MKKHIMTETEWEAEMAQKVLSYTKDVFINGEKINTTDMLVNKEKALYNKYIVVRRGKKKYYLVIFN